MRYHVRNAQGEELVVPSLADLHALYARGFLGDDDLVRGDSAERWQRAGDMSALQGVRAGRREPRTVKLALIAGAALALALGLLLAR